MKTMNEIKRKLKDVLFEQDLYLLGELMDLISDLETEKDLDLNDYKLINMRYSKGCYSYIKIELNKYNSDKVINLLVPINN